MTSRDMPDFTPIKLPVHGVTDEYKVAFDNLRDWAGHYVFLGDANPVKDLKENSFYFYNCYCEQITDLGLVNAEMKGSTLSYIATTPRSDLTGSGLQGILKVWLSVDGKGDPWITGLSIVEPKAEILPDLDANIAPRAQINRKKWTFNLTDDAKQIVAAHHFNNVCVDHTIDINMLADKFESLGS